VKLVVGLGNPGRRYAATRHNVGFRVVERLAERHGIEVSSRRFEGRYGRGRIDDLDVGILEPQTYMNASGESVVEALRFLPVGELSQDLIVVYDDADLPFGRLRVRRSGGHGGHKGVEDVIALLGRKDFPRLRFGIGRPMHAMSTEGYVLQRFSPAEEEALPRCVERASEAVETLLLEGVVAAMNRFNAAEAEG
jgi:PTH1 family peptidyl-tRNA hydrolase